MKQRMSGKYHDENATNSQGSEKTKKGLNIAIHKNHSTHKIAAIASIVSAVSLACNPSLTDATKSSANDEKPQIVKHDSPKNDLPGLNLHSSTATLPSGPNDINGIQKWKTNLEDSLALFAGTNEQVRKLLAYLKQNASYVYYDEIGDKQKNPLKQGHDAFEITFVPGKYIPRMDSPVYYSDSINKLRVAMNFKVQEWQALVFAHELTHVVDIKKGNTAETPDERAKLEVRAYTLEIDLLKSWSPKTFERMIAEGMPIYQKRHSEKEKTIADLDQLITRLYSLTPDKVTLWERRFAMGLCMIAIAFAEAEQKGGGQDALAPAYLDYMNVFLKRPGGF